MQDRYSVMFLVILLIFAVIAFFGLSERPQEQQSTLNGMLVFGSNKNIYKLKVHQTSWLHRSVGSKPLYELEFIDTEQLQELMIREKRIIVMPGIEGEFEPLPNKEQKGGNMKWP